MDIAQMKIFLKNKIDSEKLTKQVRDVIKIADWQKQDMREGFKESFSPLIQSQESIKKSIDEQQNATLEQLKKNQLALTDKENKLDQLTSAMLALMGTEKDGQERGKITGEPKGEETTGEPKGEETTGKVNTKQVTITPDYFDNYLNNKETLDVLEKYGYDRLPSTFFYNKPEEIFNLAGNIASDINLIKNDLRNVADIESTDKGYPQAKAKSLNPKEKTKENIKDYNSLSIYLYQVHNLYKFKKTMKGKGINNYKSPLQLLDRLELLGGSIIAGNNGVLQEFSEIAHLLAQMSVITKKQLNTLIKTYITPYLKRI